MMEIYERLSRARMRRDQMRMTNVAFVDEKTLAEITRESALADKEFSEAHKAVYGY